MDDPVALKLKAADAPEVHRVSIDPDLGARLVAQPGRMRPAVIVAQGATILAAISAGMIDAAKVISVVDGNWDDAILIVLPQGATASNPAQSGIVAGDAKFLKYVEQNAPDLADLATRTVAAIRDAGVDGQLVEGSGGRWINRPINTFTLKAQPRAKNLQFTLYGNPDSFDADGFLLPDQNSYSRGWVQTRSDTKRLADLTRLSHARRKR